MDNYKNLIKNELAVGWNTWNTRSVLSHTDLPSGFSLDIGIKEYTGGTYLKEAIIGRFENDAEIISPYAHSYNADYTSLNIEWKGISIDVQTAKIDDDIVFLITPIKTKIVKPLIVLESGFLWNRQGNIQLVDDHIEAVCKEKSYEVYSSNELTTDYNVTTQTPYLSVKLDNEIGFSTGKRRSVDEIKTIVENAKAMHTQNAEEYGDCSELYNAMQTCLAWDTIYDPTDDRVISTVSRLWNIFSGGYTVFCWDNYFAGFLASIDNKPLAYSNIIEITNEMTEQGFVPNASNGCKRKTLDRSQPPVGSTMALFVYKKYQEKWFLEHLFDQLFTWNTWFLENRKTKTGAFAWGSNFYEPLFDNEWESKEKGVGDTFGGALESGLDNSPMYDDVPFDYDNNVMMLDDVGLTSLFILDCNSLSEIAKIIGKNEQSEILLERAKMASKGLEHLWDDSFGLYLNKRTDNNEFSYRISPTNFYSVFDKNVSDEKIRRMLNEHLYNETEFWGEYVIPSIAKNDKAYLDQTYWRGRIWAPLNFLVYLGLKLRPGFEKDCKILAKKSAELLLKEWTLHNHVHENYSPFDGMGCGVENSDKFYHWGGLLSAIMLIEKGYM